MNFILCVLLVHNDNGSVFTQTRCHYKPTIHKHRPIVIMNQPYTKGEIHFINKERKLVKSKIF